MTVQRILVPAALCGALLAFACAPQADPEAESRAEIAATVASAMDPTADPCQDFYRYACGGWLDTTELPSDQTRWARSFSTINERNREVLRAILDDAAANPGAEPDRARLGNYYASCMDEAAIETAGATPLTPWLEKIAAVQNRDDLMNLTGELHLINMSVLFGIGVFPDFKDPQRDIAIFIQGGLGLPDRDYYFRSDEEGQSLLTAYEAHIAKMLELSGIETADASQQAADIIAFESELAKVSRRRTEMRQMDKLYNKLDLAGVQALTPDIPWTAFFQGLGHPDVVDINVTTPEFFEGLDTVLRRTSTEVLQSYLRWHLVSGTAPMLSSAFVDEDFAFYSARLRGQKENQARWKRCSDTVENGLGELLGKLYVEQQFPGDSKDISVEMIQRIETAFEKSLPELGWMDETTRERAVHKAEKVRNKIGYPDTWRDYSTMEIVAGDYFANALSVARFESDRQLNKIGEPVDPNEWRTTPATVNAFYNPLGNEITFPAGILQEPFFDRRFPATMNYGAIGAVMGHELTHGFDDQGRKFDADGQLREWWQPEVIDNFKERAQCVADFYGNYAIDSGENVNGELTLGENIADMGGVKQAYRAYQAWVEANGMPEPMVEGLTDDQLFFVSYGQIWCSKYTPEAASLQIRTDSHSPGKFRVQGALANLPEFAETFGCEVGTPMAPENRCEVW